MYCIAIAAINSAFTCAITKAPDLPRKWYTLFADRKIIQVIESVIIIANVVIIMPYC